jgi:hypothetical protein
VCITHGRGEKLHKKFLLENLNGRELRRPRCRWEDNIRMDFREMGWEGVDWVHLAQDRNQ